MRAVVDASFLLAILPGKADPSPARRVYRFLRRHTRLMAPSLIFWELGNVLENKGAAFGGKGGMPERNPVADLLRGVDLEPAFVSAATQTAVLARSHGLTFYDAAYLQCASQTPGALLFTQDRALLQAARRLLGPLRAFDARSASRRIPRPS